MGETWALGTGNRYHAVSSDGAALCGAEVNGQPFSHPCGYPITGDCAACWRAKAKAVTP